MEVSDDGTIKSEKRINDYFLEVCGENITLTRVLSEEEVALWTDPSSDLGSTNQLFWQVPTIHTAYHSISDEFVRYPSYSRVIKFRLTKEEIKQALHNDHASIGTYVNQFREREKDSVLPFDLEVIFDTPQGVDLLRKGYQRWRTEIGKDSIENPFLNYVRSTN